MKIMDIKNNEKLNGIAITGLSIRCPGANDYHEFWDNLCSGKESISFYTIEELEKAGIRADFLHNPKYVRASGELTDIDMFAAEFFHIPPREAELMDPQHRIFLECAYDALEDAGYSFDKYKGITGVYAGEGMNTYLLFNVFPSIEDKVLSSGSLEVGIGNDKDSLTTLVAYKLDLKGPALTIQSSSSTSLSSVCVACQSLFNYQCDTAIAGGVAVGAFLKNGYMHEEGGIVSSDGHCRPFDNGAHGLVPGNGAGVVVLKRLEDALKDNDNIYAVIKGYALNNDGAKKVSYSAPSVEGQAEIIIGAQAFAEMPPDTISYIEAHGTGTYIGDPIEIAALNKAFKYGTDKKNFCAISSVKANIGHLDSAAGVAGLIKTALSLKYKKIPPLINFDYPNHKIDLIDSPFYINSELSNWPESKHHARRAGVTSIGMGGTNAHVVLEEHLDIPTSFSNIHKYILPLSAKTESAVRKMTHNLVDFIITNPEVSLADIAYTMQTGRKEYTYRAAIILGNNNESINLKQKSNDITIYNSNEKNSQIVFVYGQRNTALFPEEYKNHCLYKEEMEKCIELYYQAIEEFSIQNSDMMASIPQSIDSFIDEYCVSRFLFSLDIVPDEIFITENGLYTALCMSEALSVKEAIRILLANEVNKTIDLNEFEFKLPNIKINLLKECELTQLLPYEYKFDSGRFLEDNCLYLCFDNNIEQNNSLVYQIGVTDLSELICDFWFQGCKINWDTLYYGEKRRKVSLPTYPYERKRYWIEIKQNDITEDNNAKKEKKDIWNYTQNDVIASLLRIWQNVLGIEDPGLNDNFFEVGGDSRKIVTLFSLIDKEFPGAIQMTDLFAYPAIKQISEVIFLQYKKEDKIDNPRKDDITDEININDIAVIGIAVKMPSADNTEEFWSNLINGNDCIREFPDTRKVDGDMLLQYTYLKDSKIQYDQGGYIDRVDYFDNEFFKISPKEANSMEPCQRMFLETAYESIEDAGYDIRELAGSKTGIYLGYVGYPLYGLIVNQIEPPTNLMSLSANLTAAIPSRVSHIFDFKGPALLIDTACSSSLVALHQACESLKNGDCDMAIAGGVNLRILPVKGDQNSVRLNIMDAYDHKTKSFNNHSDGTVWGEGVAAVIVKPLDKAINDHDNIYAVIKATVVNQDGNSIGMSAPNTLAQADMLLSAWDKAGIDADTLTYIETHGSGTPLGDSIEIDAIRRAFSKHTEKKQFCAIGSVKTNIGHTDATSGLAGLVKVILSLKNNVVPPSLHFENPNRLASFEKSPVYLNDKPLLLNEEKPVRCGVSSFGLSGTNAHAVLEQNNIVLSSTQKEERQQFIFVLSAKNKDGLIRNINKYVDFLCKFNGSLYDFCFTASVGRTHFEYRLAIVVKDALQLIESLEFVLKQGLNSYYKQHVFYSHENAFNDIHNDSLDKKSLAICNQYVKGNNIDWKAIYPDGNRISIPTYSFERKRCWLEMPQTIQNRAKLRNNMFYCPEWQAKKIKSDGIKKGTILFIGDKKQADLIFNNSDYKVFCAEIGVKYEVSDYLFRIRNIEEDYINLFTCLKSENIDKIIHALNLGENKDDIVQGPIISLYHLNKAFYKTDFKNAITDNFEIIILTENATSIGQGNHILSPEKAMVYGLAKTLNLENNYLNCRCIDIQAKTSNKTILDEIAAPENEFMVAYLKDERYVERIGWIDVDEKSSAKSIKVRENGVYIIAGGMGGIGFETAKYLCSFGKINILLINRTVYPLREEWEKISKQRGELGRKIKVLLEIESTGSKVEIINCDIANEKQVNKTMQYIEGCYGKVNGIINSTGVNVAKSGALLADENEQSIFDGIKAKVYGTKILEKYAKQYNVDFYVLFTSPITITSGIGMGIYTIANTFIDAFVKSSDFENIMAIGWAPWENTVKRMGDNFKEDRQLYKILSTSDMKKALSLCINTNHRLLMVGKINIGSTMFLHKDQSFSFKFKEEIISTLSEMLNSNDEADNKYLSSNNREIIITGKENEKYSSVELTVGKIIGNVLGYEKIDIHDNFYELGGDSIHALKAVNQINKELNIRMDLSDLLKHPTVFKIAKIIKEKTDTFNNGEDKVFTLNTNDYAASSSQNRLLILNDLDRESIIYNITVAKQISGNLDIGRLDAAFKNIIKRHDVFRTSFHFVNDGFIQTVHPVTDFKLLVEKGTEDQKDEMIKNFIQPFDLSAPPLIRALVIVLHEKNEYILVYDIHHIIADGLSISIFERELITLYYGSQLPNVKKQYKDFVLFQLNAKKAEKHQQDREYWIKQLTGDIPLLNMPVDYARPKIQKHNGNKICFEFDEMLTQKLRDISKTTKSTMYMILITIYNILLYKYTDQEDIIIGTPVSGRSHFDFENTIGFFANTIVLRNYPTAQKNALDFLDEIKNNCIQAFQHQDFPFDELIGILKLDRDLSRNPLFDTFFALQNYEQIENVKQEFELSPYKINNYGSKFDISIEAVDVGSKILFDLEYCTCLFSIETMQQFSNRFMQIASEFTQIETNRQITINDLKMISHEELHQINNALNVYDEQFQFESVIDLIEKQASLDSKAIAITYHSESLTYSQLCGRMNQMLFVLQENGLSDGDIVAIFMEPSLEAVICILAVLKLGAAYMPIDLASPAQRIEYMLEDSGCECIISDSSVSFGNRHNIVFNKDAITSKPRITHSASGHVSQEKLAYIMYTSGSSGKPKGVMVDHSALSSFVKAISKEIKFNSDTRILSITTMSFDISILEIIVPLCKGSKVVISNSIEQSDLKLFYNLLHKEKVNMLQMTPSRLHLLLQSCKNDIFKHINYMLIGGEPLPLDLLKKLKSLYKRRIYNLYGPTEATVWCTLKDLTEADYITIGKPLCNTAIYIMNKSGEFQPIGVPGELYIKGHGLSRGYINKPQLTEKSFIRTSSMPGDVLYKTGDMAKWLNNGELEMMGRIDRQIKIKGYRIELDEISSYITQFINIQACVTIVKLNKNNESVLCSYFISKGSVDINELRNHIASFLPHYMVPQFLCMVKEFPVNQNGKLNYSAFPDPLQQEENCSPENEIEKDLTKIFKDLLQCEDISTKKSFFELGGNSLDATNLVFKIQQDFKIKIPLIEIFKLQNIFNIARYIETHSNKELWDGIPKAKPSELYPTTIGQADIYWHERMYEGNTSYNMPMVLKANKKINVRKVESILKELQIRHDALKIEFVEKGGKIYQRINQNAEISVKTINAKPGRENYTIYSCITPFNLQQAPLFKLILMQVEDDSNYFIFDMHHIITDGLSMEILLSEFMMLYDNQTLPEKQIAFIDFAVFNERILNSNNTNKKQDDYWTNVFETEYYPINISPDYDENDNVYDGSCVSWQLEPQIFYGLKKLCSELHSTANILLLSAINLLLYKLTNTDDIVVGVPIAGRYHPDTEKVVGMFVNTLPLRSNPKKNKTIKQFVNEVKENLVNAIDNQNYPINKKMAAKLHGKPLFNILYSFQKSSVSSIDQSSLGCETYDLTEKQSKYYMEFDIVDNDDYIVVNISYRIGVYKKGTVIRILNDYKKILEILPRCYELTIEDFFNHIKNQSDATYKTDDVIEVDFQF